MTTPTDFYNSFDKKLVSDWLNGNIRLERAIKFAAEYLDKHKKKTVLDLGFGLGWSSYEIAKHLGPSSNVTGVDLSPDLVVLATQLFGSDQVGFYCQDLTADMWALPTDSFDSAVLLDVYEHIPKECRKEFHEALSSKLTNDGIVIMTCPSPAHQEWLRSEKPEGLQPVDEDVTVTDFVQMASDMGGELVHYEHRSNWSNNDYVWAIISKAPLQRTRPLLPVKQVQLMAPARRTSLWLARS